MANNKSISDELMKKARGFLRITIENDEVINTEITTLIKACRQDLIRNGITSTKAESEEDSLIETAILLYLKAEFGLDNKNYEKYLYITALLKSLIKKVAKVKNCTFAKIRISGLYNFIIKSPNCQE